MFLKAVPDDAGIKRVLGQLWAGKSLFPPSCLSDWAPETLQINGSQRNLALLETFSCCALPSTHPQRPSKLKPEDHRHRSLATNYVSVPGLLGLTLAQPRASSSILRWSNFRKDHEELFASFKSLLCSTSRLVSVLKQSFNVNTIVSNVSSASLAPRIKLLLILLFFCLFVLVFASLGRKPWKCDSLFKGRPCHEGKGGGKLYLLGNNKKVEKL